MPSERVQRQIDQLLDEIESARSAGDWTLVRNRSEEILDLDPENEDAKAFLQAAERREQRLAGSAGQATESPTATKQPAPPQPTSFANGRYVVSRFLGEGGKKKVYLAHDSQLDRDVAFALIKTEGLDDAGRVRVQREAQAMGRLGNQPNIVTVYDIGDENGQPYLVLPILSGGDVEGVIEKAPEHKLPLDQALKIAIETCQGLELAHSKGIVHRDLKPGNVWLTEDGRAMIGDFGLAVAADRSRLTQAGMMVGTVSYMPPEQAMGGEVGPRSDLYSLGAMLYEMVCGRPPFVGDESVAIIGQHLNTPPVAPSWHRPDCPPVLETIILRLLEKDPAKRPASATEVREALESVTTSATPRQATIAQELPAGDNPLYRRTFVGRENEVKQLQAAFDAALSGQGGLVMVVGEPGIGKTAICEQLATYVALRGGKALIGHCYEEGSLSLPYLAFVEAMRSYVLAREPDGLRSDLGTGAADVARIVSEVRDRLQGVELRPNIDPEDDRWRLLQAVTTFLKNASTVQSLVIVLEDLHWADRGTLDLLLHISRNLEGTRLLLVGTYRDVEVDRSHPLSNVMGDLRRINNFQRIPLRGLTAEEVQRMMAGVAQRDIPWPFAELLHRQTEGSPLFVQEMLRYLVEEGLVSEQAGQLRRVGDDALSGRIPEGLRDVIGRRLSRLSGECNRLLAIASVIGRDFRLATLQAVAGVDEEALVSALEEATKVGVLEEQARTGVITYRFTHAFFRQTLYEELSAPRRLRMHQEVAKVLEAEYAVRRQEHAAELAEHFSNSTDRNDLAKAVEYGELAAQRSLLVFDYGEAVRLLEKTIDVQEVLDHDDNAKRCDLLLALAAALGPAGEPLRVAEEVAEDAFQLAEMLQDDRRASRAFSVARDGMTRYGGRAMGGSALFRRWAERGDRCCQPGTLERVEADIALALLASDSGDFEKAIALTEAASATAHTLDDLTSISWVAIGALQFDAPVSVQNNLYLAEEISARAGSILGRTAGVALHQAGRTFLANGDRHRAEVLWQQIGELAKRTQDPDTILRPLIHSAQLAILDGQLEQAIDLTAHFTERAHELGMRGAALGFSINAASRAFFYLGRFDEVLVGMGRAQEASGGSGGRQNMLAGRRPLCLAGLGRTEEASIIVRHLLTQWTGEALTYVPFSTQINLLEASVVAGDSESTAILLPVLARGASLLSCQPDATCIARHLGDGLALLGKQEDARRYYNQAQEVCAKVRFRPEIALTRLSLAELLLDHYPDERDAAIDHLDFAIAELRDMKMQPALERALRHRGLLKA